MSRMVIALGLIAGISLWAQEGIRNTVVQGKMPGPETPVTELLHGLGEDYPEHYLPERNEGMVRMGEELVKKGRTVGPDGKMTRYVSRYFVCTSCHNLEREDPDLRVHDPETRLSYAEKMGLPFLQGTTFWGIVNRERWYNDDYVKKYGASLEVASKDLRESIKLCAVECSQGRALEDWETEAMLAYMWTLELKMGDLDFSGKSWQAARDNMGDRDSLIALLKSHYHTKSPATFGHPDFEVEPDYAGDPARGELIYAHSCQHCHKPLGVSEFLLDNSKFTFRKLRNHLFKEDYFSIYVVIRAGTKATPGARPYMPHYPMERLSDRQIKDLQSFILAQNE